MRALLFIAHGSRREASNQEVIAKAAELQTLLPEHHVQACFLELSDMLIPTGFDACVAKGATEIHVFPYFLAAGRHIIEDIPHELRQCQAKHPEITINMLPYLGKLGGINQLIVSSL